MRCSQRRETGEARTKQNWRFGCQGVGRFDLPIFLKRVPSRFVSLSFGELIMQYEEARKLLLEEARKITELPNMADSDRARADDLLEAVAALRTFASA